MREPSSLDQAVAALRSRRADSSDAQRTEARIVRTLQTRTARRTWFLRALTTCALVAAFGGSAYAAVYVAPELVRQLLARRADVSAAALKRVQVGPRAQHHAKGLSQEPSEQRAATAPDEPLSDARLAPAVRPSRVRPSATSPRPDTALPQGKPQPAEPSHSAGQDALLYARAHELHFARRDFAAALAAWDAYLNVAADGPFAPEARYNRALCLIRLGQNREADAALAAFAEASAGSYRRREARALRAALERVR